MKIKDGFMLREVAGNYIIVAIGDNAVDFNGIMNVNETGAFLWNKLIEEVTVDDLVLSMTAEYDIDSETARVDIDEFINMLNRAELLCNE